MNRQFIKDLLPPFLVKALRTLGLLKFSSHWSGNYATWDHALKNSMGYDNDEIIEKVKSSLLKVKNEQAVHERDSVLFKSIEYTWPVLAGLLWVHAQERRLNLIDYGGSLGSTYFQNRKFIQSLRDIRWNIVEQSKFVQIGLDHFQNDELRFYRNMASCLKENNVNCILLSSVLPYIRDPYDLLLEIEKLRIKFLILDKMPFIDGSADRITVQKTPKHIYTSTYPSWFFSESKFKSFIENKYSIVEEFLCPDEANIRSIYKGIILQLK